jgi:glycosyltransferase involved in cell wall biosynthesis
MADALVNAIRNPGEIQALVQHGRRIVLENYDWSVLAQKLERAWEKSLCASST